MNTIYYILYTIYYILYTIYYILYYTILYTAEANINFRPGGTSHVVGDSRGTLE